MKQRKSKEKRPDLRCFVAGSWRNAFADIRVMWGTGRVGAGQGGPRACPSAARGDKSKHILPAGDLLPPMLVHDAEAGREPRAAMPDPF